MKNDATELVGQNDAKEIPENSFGTKPQEPLPTIYTLFPSGRRALG